MRRTVLVVGNTVHGPRVRRHARRQAAGEPVAGAVGVAVAMGVGACRVRWQRQRGPTPSARCAEAWCAGWGDRSSSRGAPTAPRVPVGQCVQGIVPGRAGPLLFARSASARLPRHLPQPSLASRDPPGLEAGTGTSSSMPAKRSRVPENTRGAVASRRSQPESRPVASRATPIWSSTTGSDPTSNHGARR